MSEVYHDRPKWIVPKTRSDDAKEELTTPDTPIGDESEGTVTTEPAVISLEEAVAEAVQSTKTRVAVIDRPRGDNGTGEGLASKRLIENGRSPNGSPAQMVTEVPSGARSCPPADDAEANGHASSAVSETDSIRRSTSVPVVEPAFDESRLPQIASLVQVQCFGDFRVRSGERELNPLGEEKASYRAWEVLAFLAAHRAGPVSKEKLFAAIWPDADEEAASNCLRQALFRLRAVLSRQIPGVSSDVVRNERDGTCRLDPKQVSSDVQEFLALCDLAPSLPPEQARTTWERMLTLYDGDLFSGRGTRAFAWVDERDGSGTTLREQYRESYFIATQRLARLYCRMGQPEQAVPLLKGLLKAEPTLEDVVRDLYRCYRQLYDLGSLIREDRHLRQALREGLYDPSDPDDDPRQYQPEEATIDLYNDIRAELEDVRLGNVGVDCNPVPY
jgi:DNA-binding SARP family transcriptional activator